MKEEPSIDHGLQTSLETKQETIFLCIHSIDYNKLTLSQMDVGGWVGGCVKMISMRKSRSFDYLNFSVRIKGRVKVVACLFMVHDLGALILTLIKIIKFIIQGYSEKTQCCSK